ncbi:Ubiquitin carboxyl-terminal hydrolase family protein, partial [Aphelenchoides avenae]
DADEVYDSADAMEITDLSLEEIQRLPETHQLCKAVKRRLLDKFKHAAKMEMIKKKPSTADFATATHMAEGLGSSGTDDAQLSSGDTSEQAQTVQTGVEKLRSALADANHAKLVHHAQNVQLHLLPSQTAVAENEQGKTRLQLEKRRLETEKSALRLQPESYNSLATEQAQRAATAEEKDQNEQSENAKLHETLAAKERANLAQGEQINLLESNLRDTQARAHCSDHDCNQLRAVNEGLVEENANLRRRIAELEASISSCGAGKRQATEECDGVNAKRGRTERGKTSTDIQHLLQSVLLSDRTMREGFFKNFLLGHELIFKHLVDAPLRETRESFARLLCHFLQEAREDDLSTVDLSSMSDEMFCRDDRTITDSVLRLLSCVPRNHFNDFLRQPKQFFDLVMSWVEESVDNRKRFINVGGLRVLLTLIGRDDPRTRSVCSEFPVIFDIIYLLLSACWIEPEEEASTSADTVIESQKASVFAPVDVHEWITEAQNVQHLIQLLLEHAKQDSTVRSFVWLLCYDNMLNTTRVLAHLHFDRIRMSNQRVQRNFLQAFRGLMKLSDGHQPQRILLGVLGDDRIKGFIKVLLGMRNRYKQPHKAMQLLDEFTLLYEDEDDMQRVLSRDIDFATSFLEMTEWLSRQVDAKSQRGLSSRFKNRTAADRERATEILDRCKFICYEMRISGALRIVKKPIYVTCTDTEEDEGV